MLGIGGGKGEGKARPIVSQECLFKLAAGCVERAERRRVATRIDGVEWVPLSLKNLQKADRTLKSAMGKIESIEKWKNVVRLLLFLIFSETLGLGSTSVFQA